MDRGGNRAQAPRWTQREASLRSHLDIQSTTTTWDRISICSCVPSTKAHRAQRDRHRHPGRLMRTSSQRVQWRARPGGIAGIPGIPGNVVSVSYRI